jgi:opacity protein-like surface antigen
MRKLPNVAAALVAAVTCAFPALAHADAPGTHDGFYLRAALGLGYLQDTASATGGSEAKFKGGGVAGEFLLGGTPAPGLVVGGGFQSASFPDPKFESRGYSGTLSGALNVSTFGPFVDYYLDPRGGFHIQGFVGYGILSAKNTDGSESTKNPSGLAISAGVGQDWFVSDSWSIGVLGRLQYLNAKYSVGSAEVTHSVLVPAVLASFTYH